MPIRNVNLFILLLIYLSGTFTLNRLNLGFSIEIKYLFLVAFIFLNIIAITLKVRNQKISLNNQILIILVTMFFYLIYTGISLYFSSSQLFSFEKFLSNIFLFILILCTLFVVSEYRLDSFDFFVIVAKFFILIGILYSFQVFIGVLSGENRGDVGLSGPNVSTRIFFFATCSSLYFYWLKKKNYYFVLSVLFLASIVLVGSRGGLIGAVFTLLLWLVVNKLFVSRKIKRKIKFSYRELMLIPLCLVVFYFAYEPVKKVVTERIIGVTFQDNGQIYTSGRDLLYAEANLMIKEKPILGHGLSGFTIKTGQVYPHNLLLEMMVEIGIFGAVIFFIFFFYSIWIIFKMKNSSISIFSILPLYMIVVQMFSGEFYDFRYYFLWIIPLLYSKSFGNEELRVYPEVLNQSGRKNL